MREPEGRLLEMSWDGFDESLRRELDWFWRDQRTLTDVTLFCDGGSVRAHKLVLALSSPYFLNMCIETQTGCNNSVISLRGVDVTDFKLLLEFMYRGHVLVDENRVEHVVKLARALHVRGFGSEREVRKKRDRNGSVGSVFADSDGDENDENNQRRKVYILPEEIALDDAPPNRVTRASLANQEVARSSRRLSESRPLSPEKKELGSAAAAAVAAAAAKDAKACLKRPPLIASKSLEKSGNASQDSRPSPRKLREKTPTATVENEAPKDSGASASTRREPSKRHVCKCCDFTAATATVLATHLVQKHHPMSPRAAETPTSDKQSPEKPKESPKEELSPLICDICGFAAGNAGALGSHRNRHKQQPVDNNGSGGGSNNVPTAASQAPKVSLSQQTLVAAFSGGGGSSSTSSPLTRETSPIKSPLATDVSLQIATSEHFKIIYDCPRCIKISFKTPHIMTRHLMKRHPGEHVQPVTRVNCGHCEHAFGVGERVDSLVSHLKQTHGIDAQEVKEVMPVKIKIEPSEEEDEASHLPAPITNKQSCLTGETTCAVATNGTVSGLHAVGEPPTDTASNADTERASSRESFVLSPTPNAVNRAANKRSRLSHDDEATIESPEVSPNKMNASASITTTPDLLRIKREVDASNDVPENPGVFHKCPECNYHTSQEHFLKRHMIACHSNGKTEEPFLCKYCNFSTGHRSTIKSHLVMVHRDTTTKVKDCFRNAAEINRLEQTTREEAKKRLQQKVIDRAATSGATATESKVGRKRKTLPLVAGSSPPKSSVVSVSPKTSPAAAVTPITRPKRNRTRRSESAVGSSSGILKSPSPKTTQTLHKFEAALKLKKAAIAKQRRRSETTTKATIEPSSPKTSTGRQVKGTRRSRSRLRTPERKSSEEAQTTAKRAASTGSIRTSTGTTSTVNRDAPVDLVKDSRKDTVNKEKETTKELKCPDCTYVAKSQLMFDKHVSLHSSYDETKLALCEVCGVVMLKVSMGYHMKKHEPRDSGPNTPVGKGA